MAQTQLFPKHPTCSICGRELVKVISGLVCTEMHGPIIPVEEFVDSSFVPVDHSKCETVKQKPTGMMLREVERAMRALRRIEKKERAE